MGEPSDAEIQKAVKQLIYVAQQEFTEMQRRREQEEEKNG